MSPKRTSKPSPTKSKRARTRPASKSTSSPARKSPTRSRTTSTKTKSPPKNAPAEAQPARQSFLSGMSLDRRLDLIGVILSLLGLITVLSLLSTNRSSLTGAWIWFLKTAFGWGAYVLPAGLITLGVWLILRHFERIPWPSLERVVGVSLVFFNLLVWLQFALAPASRQASFELAAKGLGGGYTGAALFELFLNALGGWGTAIVLLSWFLMGLALSLDTSILDLFGWTRPITERLAGAWQDQKDRITAARQTEDGLPPGYQPLPPLDGLPAEALNPAEGLLNSLIPAAGEPLTWVLPPVSEMLEASHESTSDDEIDVQRAQLIEETLASFGAPAHVVEINRGPTITQFGVEPDFIESRSGRTRVRVNKISALADDLALALAAKRIRIQAPVPGKGYVGIEVPNEQPNLVTLRDVIDNEAFRRLKSPLRFALGQDVAGNAVAADLASMPHLLIAGATGSGKSVCVNGVITCLLVNNTPDDLRIVMVDPKRVELTGYNGIPHLLAPVVVELERVVGALQWIQREMDQRYHKFARLGARNIADFNQRQAANGEKKLPYLVIIIDELADLMMIAPDETERSITRLAQLARATGIHLVIATQRPSVDVVTGLIKANFPARIAFAVASGVDSRVILDQPGAERLLGSGDMLFQAPDAPAPVRLQGVFVSDNEISNVVNYWRSFAGAVTATSTAIGGTVDSLPAGIPLKQMPLWEEMKVEEDKDPLMDEAVDLVRRQGRASISMLQRRLRIGYTRAARLIEVMEEQGIIGTAETGGGTREVLDYGPTAPPADES